MNANRLVNMLVRRLVNRGINRGIGYAARRGKAPGQMTSDERTRAQSSQKMGKRARQALRLGRRFTRF
ncbi:hypothetical protein AAD018_008715 [Aestuariibius insulae]|uniref:hypothetical protein n=1 Tax=Aestuariibius insulae TaxID=2058287 RepID=UPI00345E9EC5